LVDPVPSEARELEAMLVPHGFEVQRAECGAEALALAAERRPDVVLLDVRADDMEPRELCRRLGSLAGEALLPVVAMARDRDAHRLEAIAADDELRRPVSEGTLLARLRAVRRLCAYHDRARTQAAELAAMRRLLRFLPAPVAVAEDRTASHLRIHRRDISVVFCDLRGFTAFAETAEPEEELEVLRAFYETAGQLVQRLGATVGYLAGDGLMAFYNDPGRCSDPPTRAVELALAMREALTEPIGGWRRRGYRLGVGLGVAYGYATLGEVGFGTQKAYGVIGSVVNLASRLCDHAAPGQVLVGERVMAAVDACFEARFVGELALHGFREPVRAYAVVRPRARHELP
jgi:class 3 adenylate cyclase